MTGGSSFALRIVVAPDDTVGMRDRFEVTARETRFGRASHCDWVLPGAGVSRLHAIVRRLNGRYLIEDRSANGTWLNGERMPQGEPCSLTEGDRLRIDVFEIVVGEATDMTSYETPLPRVVPKLPSELIEAAFVPAVVGDALWTRDVVIPADRSFPVSMERAVDERRLRAAFDAFLASFDPRGFDMAPALRQRHGLKGDGGAWGRYQRHFQHMSDERDEHFRRLFGEVLTREACHNQRNER